MKKLSLKNILTEIEFDHEYDFIRHTYNLIITDYNEMVNSKLPSGNIRKLNLEGSVSLINNTTPLRAITKILAYVHPFNVDGIRTGQKVFTNSFGCVFTKDELRNVCIFISVHSMINRADIKPSEWSLGQKEYYFKVLVPYVVRLMDEEYKFDRGEE